MLGIVDYVLVMSVNPGFGGQMFIPGALQKISKLYMARAAKGLQFQIEVDGGVSTDTIGDLVTAGTDIFVAGNAVYGSGNPAVNVQKLQDAAQHALMQQA